MIDSSSNATKGVLLAALASVGFGLLGFFGKNLISTGLGVAHILMMRFWIATPLLWVYLIWRNRNDLKQMSRRQMAYCFLLGALGYAGQALLYFTALRELKSGLASILLYLYPAVIAFFVTIIHRRPPTRVQGVVMLLALCGCWLVVDIRDVSITNLGLAAGIGSAIWYAAYLIASEIIMRGVRPTVASGFILIGTLSSISAYAFLCEASAWPPTLSAWGYAGAMALLSTLMPVVALFLAIQFIGTVRASIVCTLEPVVTLLVGFFLLAEELSVIQVVGVSLILATLVVLRLEDQPESPQPKRAT